MLNKNSFDKLIETIVDQNMPSKAYIDRIESITPEGIFLHLSIIGPKSVKIEQIESKNPNKDLERRQCNN